MEHGKLTTYVGIALKRMAAGVHGDYKSVVNLTNFCVSYMYAHIPVHLWKQLLL